MSIDAMVEDLFAFLVCEHHLNYEKQHFKNCYGGHWSIDTYSYFNDIGCFTICSLPARDELSFFYSSQFSKNYEELCENYADVYSLEPTVWNNHAKFGKYYKPFFFWSKYRILKAVSNIIEVHLEHHKELFSIRWNK